MGCCAVWNSARDVLLSGSAAYEMYDQRNHRDNDQNVDKPAGEVERGPTYQPGDEQQEEQDQEEEIC